MGGRADGRWAGTADGHEPTLAEVGRVPAMDWPRLRLSAAERLPPPDCGPGNTDRNNRLHEYATRQSDSKAGFG